MVVEFNGVLGISSVVEDGIVRYEKTISARLAESSKRLLSKMRRRQEMLQANRQNEVQHRGYSMKGTT